MFLGKEGDSQVHLCIYVDDIIIATPTTSEITSLLQQLKQEFPIRDIDVEIERVDAGLHLTQSQYLTNLLRSCDMANVKPAATPMVPNIDLHIQSESFAEPSEYKHIVGSLQYVMLTRSNVQVAMNILSQFMEAPK